MVFFSGFIFFGRYHRSTQSSRPNVFHMSTRLLGLGIYLILIVFVLIGNPLSVMLYNNGKPFFDGANHNFSPRALFLASIGVYVYSATTGVAMFIFASTWRTLKKRMAPL
ncbi:hypothetical protein LPJ61_001303 [Coemansia biformis]|uniref:Uncharacterized protein n=1 Tax=Coemansia biformis TaxID=1286918 RepID=A0A9W8D0S6_9FUNG|nr:hypothetical protein LPJ61_001303 [Coemansia biformis]